MPITLLTNGVSKSLSSLSLATARTMRAGQSLNEQDMRMREYTLGQPAMQGVGYQQADRSVSQSIQASIDVQRNRVTSQVQRINDQLWEVWPDGRRKLLNR